MYMYTRIESTNMDTRPTTLRIPLSQQLQAALETVRCEELQLELSSALKSRPGRLPTSSSASASIQTQRQHTTISSLGTTSTEQQSHLTHNQEMRRHNPLPSSLSGGGLGGGGTGSSGAGGTTVTWASPPTQATEIDRIMAKIEQARLSIANVCVTGYHQQDYQLQIHSNTLNSPLFGFHIPIPRKRRRRRPIRT